MKRTGFTLIELLVVIAIIAILAAILFPVFARAREKALANTCLSNVKQITLSCLMYCTDYDNRFPNLYLTNYGETAANRIAHGNWTWYDPLEPYIKNAQIWVCPDDPTVPYNDMPDLPSAPSYVANGALFGNGNNSPGFPINMIQNVAETYVIGPINANQNPRLMGYGTGGDWWFAITNLQANIYTALFRHNNGENWGLADGHAKFYNWQQFYYLSCGTAAAPTPLPAGYAFGADYDCQ
jgi:prepilin-type N-terminal cleavage/methylation domain-containing protein